MVGGADDAEHPQDPQQPDDPEERGVPRETESTKARKPKFPREEGGGSAMEKVYAARNLKTQYPKRRRFQIRP